MQRKVAVSGDVSQLVTGNVVHEAPATVQQQNNHVTYNLQSAPEPKYLSWRQRQTISGKVDEVAHAEGVERLVIYKTLLSDHGALNMKVMPADRFRAIMDDLAVWLSEAKSRNTAANDGTPAPGEDLSPATAGDPSVGTPAQSARSKIGALHWLISICAAGAGAFLMWDKVAAETHSTSDVCHFEGKAYSVGSVTTMPPAGVYECQAAADDAPSKWVPARNLGSAAKPR